MSKISELLKGVELGINLEDVEVHEGDILKFTNPKHPKRKYCLHKIEWHDERLRFLMIRTTGEGNGLKSLQRYPDHWTVIGNYNDNPELFI